MADGRETGRAMREPDAGAGAPPGWLGYHDRAPTPAVVDLVSYDRSQRLARAIAGGLTCWGLAVVALFVPLLHFVLVPGLLIAGPIVFRMRLAESRSLRAASGTCPVCGAEQRFRERGPLKVPHPLRCGGCGRMLALTLGARPEAAADAGPTKVEVTIYEGGERH